MLSTSEFQILERTAHNLADHASRVTLRYFRTTSLKTEDKYQGAGFDPVTMADRGAESAMRAVLARERPQDSILGEEEQAYRGRSGLTWVIDPIDGTRSYIAGVPVWGTLIALDDGCCGRIGIVDQPYLGERFVGLIGPEESRAWLDCRDQHRPLKTRQGVSLDRAILYTTDQALFSPNERRVFQTISERVQLTRYGIDCYAYAMLAMGLIDLIIESGLQAYDIAAHIPLIRGAGGVITDWNGGDCRWGGRAVAAGNAQLHDQALAFLDKVPQEG